MLPLFTAFVCACLAAYCAAALLLRRALARPAPANFGDQPFVSVVIAARNEGKRLGPLLADLAAQDYPNFEVVVVDDRSTDDTAALVERAARAHPGRFRLVRQLAVPAGESPKKHALQKGVEASTGEIILLTDADCRVRPTWVSTMVRYFNPSVAMVLGYSELSTTRASTLFERVQGFEFLTLVATMAASANLGRPFGATGQNLAIRRAAFERVKGFRTLFRRVAGDDIQLLQLVKDNPEVGRVVYADDAGARNRTHPEPTWRAFRQQRARWASSGTHNFRRDKLFMAYALAALVVNMTVLSGGAWAWAGVLAPWAWPLTVVSKLAADLLFYGAALRRFQRLALLRYLPLWLVAQPIYLLLMAYWGTRQKGWTWKPDGQTRHAVEEEQATS